MNMAIAVSSRRGVFLQRFLCMAKACQGAGATTADSLLLVSFELAQFSAGKQVCDIHTALFQGKQMTQQLPYTEV